MNGALFAYTSGSQSLATSFTDALSIYMSFRLLGSFLTGFCCATICNDLIVHRFVVIQGWSKRTAVCACAPFRTASRGRNRPQKGPLLALGGSQYADFPQPRVYPCVLARPALGCTLGLSPYLLSSRLQTATKESSHLLLAAACLSLNSCSARNSVPTGIFWFAVNLRELLSPA